jgi:hypothetical protein
MPKFRHNQAERLHLTMQSLADYRVGGESYKRLSKDCRSNYDQV